MKKRRENKKSLKIRSYETKKMPKDSNSVIVTIVLIVLGIIILFSPAPFDYFATNSLHIGISSEHKIVNAFLQEEHMSIWVYLTQPNVTSSVYAINIISSNTTYGTEQIFFNKNYYLTRDFGNFVMYINDKNITLGKDIKIKFYESDKLLDETLTHYKS